MEESIFVIAALINMKNHRSIILAIVFFIVKKTPKMLYHKAKITGSYFSHWLAVQFYPLVLK